MDLVTFDINDSNTQILETIEFCYFNENRFIS